MGRSFKLQPRSQPKKKYFKPKEDKEVEEACWDGYKQVGMKKKNGKNVPNCVPEDAPANAVGDGSNVALPPKHEPGIHPLSKSHKKYKDKNDAEAALRKLLMKKFSTTISENKETKKKK